MRISIPLPRGALLFLLAGGAGLHGGRLWPPSRLGARREDDDAGRTPGGRGTRGGMRATKLAELKAAEAERQHEADGARAASGGIGSRRRFGSGSTAAV